MTVRENLVRTLLASGVTIGLLVGVATAATAKEVTILAPPSDEHLTERVAVADLDLTQANGIRELNGRVRGAVKTVCAPIVGQRMPLVYGQCASTAWKGARPQMARAISRAREIAATGKSAIPAVAIVVTAAGQ